MVRAGSEGGLLWTTWQNYPKVVLAGDEYAVIGGRYYTNHAIDRMTPSGLRYSGKGPGKKGGVPQIVQAGGDYGRSVSPAFVEYVIRHTNGVLQNNGNLSYRLGDLQVITNRSSRLVVTVITH